MTRPNIDTRRLGDPAHLADLVEGGVVGHGWTEQGKMVHRALINLLREMAAFGDKDAMLEIIEEGISEGWDVDVNDRHLAVSVWNNLIASGSVRGEAA